MEKKKNQKGKPDPKRMEALKSLPAEILQRLTKEEVDSFLYDEVWPDSLGEKLKNYIVREGPEPKS